MAVFLAADRTAFAVAINAVTCCGSHGICRGDRRLILFFRLADRSGDRRMDQRLIDNKFFFLMKISFVFFCRMEADMSNGSVVASETHSTPADASSLPVVEGVVD